MRRFTEPPFQYVFVAGLKIVVEGQLSGAGEPRPRGSTDGPLGLLTMRATQIFASIVIPGERSETREPFVHAQNRGMGPG